MTVSEFTIEDVKSLLDSRLFGVLGTKTAEYPHLNLVAFAATPGAKTIIFATARKTAKFANITADGRVEILFDNNSNSRSDIARAITVTAIGIAREANGPDSETMRQAYLTKHPYLADFITSSDTAVIAIKVKRYYISGFEKVKMIEIKG